MDNTGERTTWEVDFHAYGQNPDDFPSSLWPPYLNVHGWNPATPFGTKLNGTILGTLYWWPLEGFLRPRDVNTFLHAPGGFCRMRS